LQSAAVSDRSPISTFAGSVSEPKILTAIAFCERPLISGSEVLFHSNVMAKALGSIGDAPIILRYDLLLETLKHAWMEWRFRIDLPGSSFPTQPEWNPSG